MASDPDIVLRLTELERRIDFLFDHLKLDASHLVPAPGEFRELVQPLLDQGNKPAAISLVVERTGTRLGEAKRTVEQMMGGS